MPQILDNIEKHLLTALSQAMGLAERSDFCVGYFNLRGWRKVDAFVERWGGGEGHCCRLLVGMQRLPQDELRESLSIIKRDGGIDNPTALRLKKRLAEEFRHQLTLGMPTNDDEAGLQRLAAQIKAKKVVVKLFLRHPLHAKLYLLFRPDPINPVIGYLGSSNLTLAGLANQGELNVDVMDHDACRKLAKWFEDRWNDKWCLDISDELLSIIQDSWAREQPLPPYHIYLKMAYHLSQEARFGLTEFRIPRDFGQKLFDFQVAAVKIAAHHLNKRGGVLIGDVVGLGKTLMATAVARIFEDDHGVETLIICPKNLVSMWEDYCHQYRLRAKVLSISRVIRELPQLRRYRLVLIDESHNLRNRTGKRYRAIQEYIRENESKVILLTATPYNKTYLDLANQLRLFIPDELDLGMRPEKLLRELTETEFQRRHQCPVRSLAAFEKSEYADDWRELMRLYLVRRTRTFIKENYAHIDPSTGRSYLTFEDGTRSWFPERQPKTVKFAINDKDPADQYARLFADDVVHAIEHLNLPRYGLGNYVPEMPHEPPMQTEIKVLQDLSRAGRRLMGFCRTNLFKRLESGGHAFIQSVERHILRNYIYLHAIEAGLPLPIGTQDAAMLDARIFDGDADDPSASTMFLGLDEEDDGRSADASGPLRTEKEFRRRATEVYAEYAQAYKKRFKWLRPALFVPQLAKDLRADIKALLPVLTKCGNWEPGRDAKLKKLMDLLRKIHANDKVLIFTQFADTASYLAQQLRRAGITGSACVTGDTADPTSYAWRFSPESNHKRERVPPDQELRVIVATDVLSEGQNLQDAAIVVNYDLPWAIIRLVQRAGRVDRIGQKAETIRCYSFLPADGVERILGLRRRVRKRLRENAEVVGTDEQFFEDDSGEQTVRDLFTEKSGILDDDPDSEVDLGSSAYQIWKNAIDRDPSLEKIVPALPEVVYSTRQHALAEQSPEGVLVYVRTAQGNDALAWMDSRGRNVTESQFAILKMAECRPDAPALPRLDNHHELVAKGVQLIAAEEKSVGGQLGRPSGARFRAYERLKHFIEETEGTLLIGADFRQALNKAVEEIYAYPLRQAAIDALNRQLRGGIADDKLAELVVELRAEGRLCIIHEEEEQQEPRIICSMGLRAQG
ncbi:MAG: NgoFVII family restriction endonuclease [Rhodopirellula sp.]|nr:NgoFVII family restriction endonuclease [Rhodopirellula sp.]